ncbi:hypothetical protein AN641_05445 [Candidatus Epulonipiscioides gigas]|nr:hypothetical protein AN641_05445 [Epulopiscium sp. SCG-C07WGA-EpuloA2]
MLDLVVVLFIVILGLVYLKKGLVLAIYGFLSIIFSYIIAILFYPVIANYIKLTTIDENIKEAIHSFAINLELAQDIHTQAEIIREKLTLLPESFLQTITLTAQENNLNIIDYLTILLSDLIINIISILILFIATKFILFIIKQVLTLFINLPVIKTLDRMGGLLLGLVQSLFWIWMFCLIIPFFVNDSSFPTFTALFEQSRITKWFYDNNLILDYISNF